MVLIAAAVRKAEGDDKQQLLIRGSDGLRTCHSGRRADPHRRSAADPAAVFDLLPDQLPGADGIDGDLFQKMRSGKQMVVAAMNIQQKTMGFPVPLTGFTKAYDGCPSTTRSTSSSAVS